MKIRLSGIFSSFSFFALMTSFQPLMAASAECDRACLESFANQYYSAIANNDPALVRLSADVKYSENGRLLEIGDGHWQSTGPESYRMQIFDTLQGGIGTHAVIPMESGLAVMIVRLKVEAMAISEIEAVVVYEDDDSTFHNAANLAGTKPSYFWTWEIREAERNYRHELISAAEGYFRAFMTEGTPDYVRAPLLPDTLRVENGMQTTLAGDTAPVGSEMEPLTAAAQFDMALFTGAIIWDRHYPVVDEQTGTVLAMVRFGGPTGRAVVGEFFAVTQGKIREIQAVFTTPEIPTTPIW